MCEIFVSYEVKKAFPNTGLNVERMLIDVPGTSIRPVAQPNINHIINNHLRNTEQNQVVIEIVILIIINQGENIDIARHLHHRRLHPHHHHPPQVVITVNIRNQSLVKANLPKAQKK